MKNMNLIKRLNQVFNMNRPKLAVDDPNHCVACNETQEAHENLPLLKDVTANDFRLCFLSIEALSEEALQYYIPKLIELSIAKAEITKGGKSNFVAAFLTQLTPNEFSNRFCNYSKLQIIIMTECLVEIHKTFFQESYEYWDYESELLIENTDYKENVELCEHALIFWKSKSTQSN